jgi:outer membrane protein assembly factor BamB
MIADGLLLAMNDEGWLTIAEPSPTQYKTLARARVIENGASSWGPMALAGGRLIVRDFTRMVCLDVSERQLP